MAEQVETMRQYDWRLIRRAIDDAIDVRAVDARAAAEAGEEGERDLANAAIEEYRALLARLPRE